MTEQDLWVRALELHRSGDLAGAEALYRQILAADPDHPDANHNLGMIAIQVGRPDLGLPHFQSAMAARPGQPLYSGSLIEALFAVGQGGEASRLALAEARKLIDSGRGDDADALIERAVGAGAPAATAYYNLASIHHHAGEMDRAIAAYCRSIEAGPPLLQALCNLACALLTKGDAARAEAVCRQAIEARPDFADAWYNLGVILGETGRSAEALAAYDQTLTLAPHMAEAHNNRGGILNEMGRFADSVVAHRVAIALDPNNARAHYNLGNSLRDLGELEAGVDSYRAALALDPRLAEAHNALGNAVKTLGRLDEALDHFRKAIEIEPGNVLANVNLVVATLYHPGLTQDQRRREHELYEARHARPRYPASSRFDVSRVADRRLRIGYLSTNINHHPVARNIEPLIAAHDPAKVEVHFYADITTRDETTDRFRAMADGWRELNGLDDAAAAELIRADKIDVLITLAGHFDANRPLVCAYRPAPVLVSFHEPLTSGMTVMDALITDPVLTPRGGAEYYAERPMRLPSYYLHAPVEDGPEVSPLPMLSTGRPTFGSFNNPAKLSDDALRLWARVMEAVPEARLRLKYRNWFAADSLVRRVHGFMAERGVGPERVELLSAAHDTASHLALYHGVDIALDPFPFTGSTTTFESLWMGVPVVTLPGDIMVSRWSASMLTALGRRDLIAASADDYVDICRRLARSPEDLAAQRAGLRQRVAASPLCDAKGKARHLERICRALWRRWLASQS